MLLRAQAWSHIVLRRQVSGYIARMRSSVLGELMPTAYSLSQNPFLECPI